MKFDVFTGVAPLNIHRSYSSQHRLKCAAAGVGVQRSHRNQNVPLIRFQDRAELLLLEERCAVGYLAPCR